MRPWYLPTYLTAFGRVLVLIQCLVSDTGQRLAPVPQRRPPGFRKEKKEDNGFQAHKTPLGIADMR